MFGTLGMIFYIVFIIVIVRIIRAAKQGSREAEIRRKSSYGAGSAQQTYRQTAAKPKTTPYQQVARSGNTRQNGADPGRVQQTLKRPTPQRPEAVLNRFIGSGDENGITFKGLPPGTDELEILIRYNRARERFLERSLESREG